MAVSIFAISFGAVVGALARWWLSLKLSSTEFLVPYGTLAANLAGGYIVGFCLILFAKAPGIAPEWRLFLVTGFCGSLTTFSTFSLEVVELVQQGKLGIAASTIACNVIGSLLLTAAGMVSANALM